ncbi:MAG: Asp-tRNA(Asn)/Glu-tRNA(Gln) amidotransferase subunit GatA [Oscillospiraceae bacterium]|nr:Asp-tRNA(Asn)/Glu-tRNA(Gln) amidotransferase subunit GatA [Ruminococcus sp.]MDY6061716.1 Asp-tRNA(Asn)/Glu-tRNA(Gln) amidotransferase subunit GatA [Oscillospiraceae bacterium]
MNEILNMPVTLLTEKIADKQLSSKEITEAYLENINKTDSEIGAYLTVTAESAIKTAEETDKKIAAGEKLSKLAGIPGGIKDNMCTKGVKTTCASKMLENFVPCYSSTAVEKLNEQGFVMLGKLNMDEFAMGSTNENSYFKPVKNPVNTERVPGGSSGGSAAAVAAKEAAFTLGSDTGGSIRQPAAFCGVVGMKPTYGTVSRYGLVAFASSLDQIGPLTKNVKDNALILNAIAGHDPKDATCIGGGRPDYTAEIGKDVKGMTVGLPTEFFGDGVSADVKDAVLAAAKRYEKLGANIEEVKLPSLKHALSAYYVISSAEASSNLARFDGIRYGYRSENAETLDDIYKNSRSEGFGPEVQRRIMLGTFALSSGYYDAYYKKALQVRTLVVRDYNKVFEKCDFIISPVAPTTAYKLGEKTDNPLEMYMGDIYSVPINIAGVPSLSLPCGKDGDNMPIGMQLIGKPLGEATLYRAGYAFETDYAGGANE